VPTLHEAANIRTVLERIRGSLDPLGIPYEVIVVDDNSQDGTADIVGEISRSDPRVRLLVRTGARGLGGAVVHGWEKSDAEIVGVIDADSQHPPELLPQLWKAMEGGTDLPTIQLLMGHEKLQDTTVYLHLSRRHLHAAVNPLERITIRGFKEKAAESEESGRS